MTRYLYDIEQAPQLLRVRRMQIKPRPANPDLLDVTFQVSTFYLQERTSELQHLHGIDSSYIAGKLSRNLAAGWLIDRGDNGI